MNRPRIAILHYAAPPVVGGVEAVIDAHVGTLVEAGYPVTVVAGRGEQDALSPGAEFLRIPRIDSQHPDIAAISAQLRQGELPPAFRELTDDLRETLAATLSGFDNVIVHNVFTKRFNLPLTAALFRLLDHGEMPNCIAWCHDVGWASAHSRPNLHPGYPWDLLRTRRDDVTYVVVSEHRRRALAELFNCPPEEIAVVHNGVDPALLLGLSDPGAGLIRRLGLLTSDLVLLMPVRVTQAKNIELALRVVAALKARGLSEAEAPAVPVVPVVSEAEPSEAEPSGACGEPGRTKQSRTIEPKALDVKLVLTGPPDPHDEESMAYCQELQALRRELDVEDEMRFVFESGPDPNEPFTVDMSVVADLLRVSDVMFMPSHREGFGMPVLEAGLVGVPVFCTQVPAAQEIGGQDVSLVSPDDDPEEIADRILSLVAERPVHRLRRRVRQEYTWSAIFRRDIQPLLARGA